MQTRHYDAIIIGSGQAGNPLAVALAKAGRQTAMIEHSHIGGTCVNVGCTPTKTMVASARVAYLARRSADYGVATGPVTVDMPQIRQRKCQIVERSRDGSRRQLMDTAGIDILMGHGRFVGIREVEVQPVEGEAQRLTADTIFINTGLRPATPDIPGLDKIPSLNSTTIMELDEVPEHLIVLGGGYVGLEFAQMFRRFGSKVTIVQRASQLLAREDADIAEGVAAILREDGIDILLQTQATHAEVEAGQIRLTVNIEGQEKTISGSHLLVATGRTPNTDGLNLEATGLDADEHGFISVNERLETGVPGIYALGDVKGGPAFTHISYDDFRIIRANLLEGRHVTIRDRQVPYTVFIDPELGRVGLTEKDARAQGHSIQVAKLQMSDVARATEADETRGFMKAIVDADNGQILGFAILGIAGGEIMSVVEIAMLGKLPYTILRDGIFAHPTLSDSLNNLFSTVS